MCARDRLTSVATMVVALILVPTLAAAQEADGWGFGWTTPGGGEVEVGAESGTQGQGPDTSGASSQPVCDWERVPEDSIAYQRWASTEDAFTLYYVDCPGEPRDIVEVPADAGGGAPAVVGVRERAVERLVLPTPRIEVNPADPVVHVETWLWVEGFGWGAVSESASAGGVTATVTATPGRVIWDMGNGEQVVCEGPGTAYDGGRPAAEQHTDCSYVYRHTSAGQPDGVYQVTATVYWELTWTVAGASGGGWLPAMSTSSTSWVRVDELQAVNE